MKVIEFIDMLNKLTDEQKELRIVIDYVDYDVLHELRAFSIDRILDDAGYVIIDGS